LVGQLGDLCSNYTGGAVAALPSRRFVAMVVSLVG